MERGGSPSAFTRQQAERFRPAAVDDKKRRRIGGVKIIILNPLFSVNQKFRLFLAPSGAPLPYIVEKRKSCTTKIQEDVL